MIKSINKIISLSHTLLSLITLNPFFERKESFSFAAFILSLPHLYLESISIHKFLCSIKKSTLYGPIGFCISYFKDILSKKCLNASSCGKSFFEYVFCFFNAILSLIDESKFKLYIFKELASDCFLNLKLVNFDKLIKGVCEIPHNFANLFIEYPFSQCNLVITLSNGILKKDSIFSLEFFISKIIKMKKGISQIKNKLLIIKRGESWQ